MVRDLRGDPHIQLTPRGRLRLVRRDSETGANGCSDGEAKAWSRIERAFQHGDGHGVLHLGAAEVGTALPPTLSFWRELGKLFVTKLRGIHDLEERRERFDLPAPDAELTALVLAPAPNTSPRSASTRSGRLSATRADGRSRSPA